MIQKKEVTLQNLENLSGMDVSGNKKEVPIQNLETLSEMNQW